MSPVARSPRAAAVATCVRPKTRKPLKTGSVELREGWLSRRKLEHTVSGTKHLGAGACDSASEVCWSSTSDAEEPVTEFMEDMCNALDRLDRRDKGKRRRDEDAISV
jgi:hypothetical protein